MNHARPTPPAPGRLHGALAWLLASVVLALGLVAYLPAVHAHLHDHGADPSHAHAAAHDDSGCAVTLFQQGVTAPLDLPRAERPRDALVSLLFRAPADALPGSPRHLLRPVRGPPRAG